MAKRKALPTRELRAFGLGVGLIIAVVATIGFWRPDFKVSPIRIAVWVTSGLLVLLGAWAPWTLETPHRLWMTAASWIGRIMTVIILTLFFLLVITPVGLVRRLLGRDPLALKKQPDGVSLWSMPDPDPRGPERYRQPF
ncbi:MAG: hypothetical protein GXP54_08485 [Deltaproteobacteria bacterium]|nr:hypothetical protein [Deltaproteobacteria bacterium]